MAALVGDLDLLAGRSGRRPTSAAPTDRPGRQLATNAYRQLAETSPDLLVDSIGDPAGSPDDLARWGRGRGIIDYVASLTDDRAASPATTLAGHSARLWDAGSARWSRRSQSGPVKHAGSTRR